jgi:imidazole glycerol-phosphate synthase subunit HisF
MLAKRIIPCLDVKNGQTVKGIQFENLRQAGDPVELAAAYARAGADELVLLDIAATHEGRGTFVETVARVGAVLDIPYTVGGGIGSAAQVEALLRQGADKISVNSAAVRRPELIDELAQLFGSQCVVIAVDANLDERGEWVVWLNGGRMATEIKVLDWVREAADRGAGEVLLTSMRHDGSKAGFANELNRSVAEAVPIPLIASGGAGSVADFADAFELGRADGALAAGVFHFGEIEIGDLKRQLAARGVPMRG